MDLNTLRIVVTLVAFAAFLGIVWWAYAPSRREALERVGRSIVEDEGGEGGR
ncbi:MAG: cbb3-type cytochrome c oxidase subunit 3 [Pseudomonadota bacterium]